MASKFLSKLAQESGRGLVNSTVNFTTRNGVGYMTLEKGQKTSDFGVFDQINKQFKTWATDKTIKLVVHHAIGSVSEKDQFPYTQLKEQTFYENLVKSEDIPILFHGAFCDPENDSKLDEEQLKIVDTCFEENKNIEVVRVSQTARILKFSTSVVLNINVIFRFIAV